MTLKEIPDFFGITNAKMAGELGVGHSNLLAYGKGKRGHIPKIIGDVCITFGLLYDEIFFANAIDHPMAENKDDATYWANLAIEAIRQAGLRGLPDAEAITARIVESGRSILDWDALDAALFTD
jgi:hypothetical protein